LKHITEASDDEVAQVLLNTMLVSGEQPNSGRLAIAQRTALRAAFDFSPPQPTPSDEKLLADLRYVADGLRRTTPVYLTASDEVWKTNGVMPVEQNDLLARFVAALSTTKGN